MISKRVRLGGLPTLWFVTVILMVRDSVMDLHQTGYGHNDEGAFWPLGPPCAQSRPSAMRREITSPTLPPRATANLAAAM